MGTTPRCRHRQREGPLITPRGRYPDSGLPEEILSGGLAYRVKPEPPYLGIFQTPRTLDCPELATAAPTFFPPSLGEPGAGVWPLLGQTWALARRKRGRQLPQSPQAPAYSWSWRGTQKPFPSHPCPSGGTKQGGRQGQRLGQGLPAGAVGGVEFWPKCPRPLGHQPLGISGTGLVVCQRPSHAQNSSRPSVLLS